MSELLDACSFQCIATEMSVQFQKELVNAYREGDYMRALRMGEKAIALNPSHNGLQQFVQLLRVKVGNDSGSSSGSETDSSEHASASSTAAVDVASEHDGRGEDSDHEPPSEASTSSESEFESDLSELAAKPASCEPDYELSASDSGRQSLTYEPDLSVAPHPNYASSAVDPRPLQAIRLPPWPPESRAAMRAMRADLAAQVERLQLQQAAGMAAARPRPPDQKAAHAPDRPAATADPACPP
eukprot:jgi/Ulvmu1/6827/UM031_0031.1